MRKQWLVFQKSVLLLLQYLIRQGDNCCFHVPSRHPLCTSYHTRPRIMMYTVRLLTSAKRCSTTRRVYTNSIGYNNILFYFTARITLEPWPFFLRWVYKTWSSNTYCVYIVIVLTLEFCCVIIAMSDRSPPPLQSMIIHSETLCRGCRKVTGLSSPFFD